MRVLTLLLFLGISLQASAAEVYGETMPAGQEPVSLEAAIAALGDGDTSPVKVRGRITEVCQKKGCWMVLAQGQTWARVRFLDYGFFVPTDLPGRDVVVYGTLSKKTLTGKEARHYEEDAGRDAGSASVRDEYAFMASSVEVL